MTNPQLLTVVDEIFLSLKKSKIKEQYKGGLT